MHSCQKAYVDIAEALQVTLAASSGSETFGVLSQQGGTFLVSCAGDALAMTLLLRV